MSLEKQIIVDVIEVDTSNCVHVRTATNIVEDGSVLSTSYHRGVIEPGQDYSGQDARVQAVCAAMHTADVVSAYQAKKAADLAAPIGQS
jgi:hypothetical protein